MATLKQRLHKKNSSGSYDVVHLETSAACVLMSDGTTVEAAVNGKAPSTHSHTKSQITDFPTSMTPSSHNHAASNITSGTLDAARIPNLAASKITSGTLPVARGGTGVTSLDTLKSALGVSTGGAEIVTGTYIGNGSEYQTISLGFTPKAVFVMRADEDCHKGIGQNWNNSWSASVICGFAINGSPLKVCSYQCIAITNGGFIVSYIGNVTGTGYGSYSYSNDYTVTYNYIAIK